MIDPHAVVTHCQRRGAGVSVQADDDVPRLRMSHGVGNRFLHDSIELRGYAGAADVERCIALHRALDRVQRPRR